MARPSFRYAFEKPEATTYIYGTYLIMDEALNAYYALGSEDEELLDLREVW